MRKKERRKKQEKNIMSASATQGGHNDRATSYESWISLWRDVSYLTHLRAKYSEARPILCLTENIKSAFLKHSVLSPFCFLKCAFIEVHVGLQYEKRTVKKCKTKLLCYQFSSNQIPENAQQSNPGRLLTTPGTNVTRILQKAPTKCPKGRPQKCRTHM